MATDNKNGAPKKEGKIKRAAGKLWKNKKRILGGFLTALGGFLTGFFTGKATPALPGPTAETPPVNVGDIAETAAEAISK